MKFRIKDDYGEEFNVEEVQDDDLVETETDTETETLTDDDIIMENEEVHDEDALTSDEISALKKLAGVVDKLLALIPIEEGEHGTLDEDEIETETEVDETMSDADEEYVEEGEEVIDTNPITDSFASLEKRSKRTKDSKSDVQEQIANKWQENYSKFNK